MDSELVKLVKPVTAVADLRVCDAELPVGIAEVLPATQLARAQIVPFEV